MHHAPVIAFTLFAAFACRAAADPIAHSAGDCLGSPESCEVDEDESGLLQTASATHGRLSSSRDAYTFKVLDVAPPRTGTQSLFNALLRLGFNPGHSGTIEPYPRVDNIGEGVAGDDEESSLLQVVNKRQVQHDKIRPIPPIGMVKVHKCASSTLQKIFQSLAVTRDMKIMFPANGVNLGWPDVFPGQDNLQKYGPPRHQFGVLANHAIFNDEMWRAYIQPDPVFVQTLREPMSQAISAYNFYVKDIKMFDGPQHESWEAHIAWLENLPDDVNRSKENGYFRNPQAHDLGWYEYVGWTAKYDNNETKVKEWLGKMDSIFGHSGNTILTEAFDEGIVLFKKKLQVGISEVAYIYTNGGLKKTQPSTDQLDRLGKLYSVDQALYDHFNATFWKQWQQDEQENKELLSQLKQANADYSALCSATPIANHGPLCKLWDAECVFICPWLERHWDAIHEEFASLQVLTTSALTTS